MSWSIETSMSFCLLAYLQWVQPCWLIDRGGGDSSARTLLILSKSYQKSVSKWYVWRALFHNSEIWFLRYFTLGSAVTSVDNGYCPEGFQSNSDYCYKLYSEPVSWEEAVATCSAQKASLSSVTRDEENYFIYNILHQHTVKATWLGLNDRWAWISGHFLNVWCRSTPVSPESILLTPWVTPESMAMSKSKII